MLTKERYDQYLDNVRGKLASKTEAEIAKVDNDLAIDFEEHFQFQQTQAEMHASGVLQMEVAQAIYSALGGSVSGSNGGWSKGVDTATKFTITQLMSELLSIKIKARSPR